MLRRHAWPSLLVLAATPLSAQILELDSTTVTETRVESADIDLTAPSREERAAELRRIPGGAATVDDQSYKTGRSSNMQDALGMATGVFVQPRFGSDEARLSIRGSGLQRTYHGKGLLLMQDGAAINLADGSFDFQAIEPLATDYIEVLRGANGWWYGAANLGGAINFVSPTGRTAPAASLRHETGSFGYQRSYAAFAHDFGHWDAFVSLSDSSQEGFRDHANQDNQRYFANIGLQLGPNLSSRFYLTHVETDSELPGSLTRRQLHEDETQEAPASISRDQRRDFRLDRFGNISVWNLGAGHRLTFSGFYSRKFLDHPIFQVLDVSSEDLGLRLVHNWDSLDDWHWQAGVAVNQGRNRDLRYVNDNGRKGRKVNELHQTARHLSLFSELEVPLGEQWALIGGLTWLHQDRDVDDRLRCNAFVASTCLAQDESFDKTYAQTLFRLGIRHDLSAALQFYGNFSQSYEPPTFGDLSGGQVVAVNQAQRAHTFELGLRWQRADLELDLSVYRSEIRDELLALNDREGQSLGTVNADHTIHQGLELGGRWQWRDFTLRGQYLFNDFRFDDDETYGDNDLAGIPRHYLKGELLWHRNGWYAGPTFEWVPVHYAVDHAETLYTDRYALWGLKAGYQPRDSGPGFFIEGRNLSDRNYVATTGVIADAGGQDSAQFLPGDGRSLYVGLSWQLD